MGRLSAKHMQRRDLRSINLGMAMISPPTKLCEANHASDWCAVRAGGDTVFLNCYSSIWMTTSTLTMTLVQYRSPKWRRNLVRLCSKCRLFDMSASQGRGHSEEINRGINGGSGLGCNLIEKPIT